jgi:signal transduction histidine kinase
MSRAEQPPSEMENLQIPFGRVATFVRQLSHDVRNNLGSMDLQAAYVAELIQDSEAIEELRKLRGMVTSAAKALQSISRNFQTPRPNLVSLEARILLEDFQERLEKQLPAERAPIEWEIALDDETICVDIEMIFGALLECCRNALHFHEGTEPIRIRAFATAGNLVVELKEKRSAVEIPPETWGQEPFCSTRRGGYGLGLFYAAQILAVHGGAVQFAHDAGSATLTTRVTLPLRAAES